MLTHGTSAAMQAFDFVAVAVAFGAPDVVGKDGLRSGSGIVVQALTFLSAGASDRIPGVPKMEKFVLI